MLGLVRAGCAPPAGPFEGIDPRAAGTLIRRPLGALSGGDFRLLEGVGPVMAGRLEAARLAAGGRLDAAALRRVQGVGPVRARRWSRGLAADRALR